ncbi:hypothetical protein P4V47_26415 [Brevibacillus laterosporus]|uniref:hypothetical protein n=1 Tax=Brevibacillus laterosporus TaxID=1465 RepID=UPI002E1A52CD|nr:hypothetical protein [Brevibacillus laterosporus]
MELGEDGSPKAYYVYRQVLIGREDAQGNYLCGSTTMLSDWSDASPTATATACMANYNNTVVQPPNHFVKW